MSKPAPDWTPANVHALPFAKHADDDEIDISEIIGLFWRRKWLVIATVLLSAILGILYVQQLPRLYYAEAKLILDSKAQNATGLESITPVISGDDIEMNSQIEVIKSRSLIGKVTDQLSLAEDPEFNISLQEPSSIGEIVEWARLQFGVAPRVRLDNHREVAIDQLTQNIKVSVLPGTHVFRISLETWDPHKSVRIVNALSSVFVSIQVTDKLESTSQAAVWLGAKVNILSNNLSEAETKAANFRSQTERVVGEQDVARSNLNLKNARGRLDSFRTSLRNATGSIVPTTDRDRNRLDTMLQDVSKLDSIVKKQTEDLLTIRQLDREAKTAGTIYEYFAQRMNEIEIQKGLQESDVKILSEAIPRLRSTNPKRSLTVAIFGFLGLLISSAYIIFRKLMDRSFTDPAELENTFGIPVIGTITQAPSNNRRALISYAINRPSSSIMESIRNIRTSLTVLTTDNNPLTSKVGNVITITSSIPGEGKTTSSILLAANFAMLKQKVLLVECDLRRSTFKSYFGTKIPVGLAHAVAEDENWKSAVWSETKTNVDIIFGGVSRKQNPADIFASQEFSNFIERVRLDYDLVLLDAPPVLPVPDARLIAKNSDNIIYLVRSASTPESTVAAGLRLFGNMGLKLDGLIITQAKKDAKYGSEYYQN